MSFETGQLLDQQSPIARQEKVQNDMYKLIQKLRGHIIQTNCAHCKAVLKGVMLS